MRRSRHCVLTAVLLTIPLFAAQAAEAPRNFAITHATVVSSPGSSLEDATIVLRDGLIVSIEPSGSVPADTVEIDGTDRWIYAGLIDAESDLQTGGSDSGRADGPGARGFGAQQPQTPAGASHAVALIHPEQHAADKLRPFAGETKRSMEKIRDLGFTAVLAVPADGILRGTSAAILLSADQPVAKILLDANVALHASFQRGGFGGGYPSSLMGSMAALRQALLDAQRHGVWVERYQAAPSGMPRPERHAAFDALLPALAGKTSVIFHTSSPHDTLAADRIGREFDLDVVVSTSSYEAEYGDALAAAGRTLIVSTGFPDKPKVDKEEEALGVDRRTMRRYLDAPAGPARLHEAGVRFALSTQGLDNKGSFHKQMVKIVEAGLPADVALAALTTVPAELLGIDRVVGTLAAGKIANLIVTDGPLFAEDTKVREVFVDGRRHELETKDKPKGDPDAVVDPRGTWSVTFQFGPRTIEREWIIEGGEGAYTGTAETREDTVEFESIELAGNVLTVVLPGSGGRPATEITAIVEGDSFAATAEMGPRTVEMTGTRVSGPDGGAR
jgi:imidazolonepropionase-like amidohydrolase